MKIFETNLCLMLLLCGMHRVSAQAATSTAALPVNIITSNTDSTRPLVLYITGDGGWNRFSKTLSTALAQNGYPVVALNAKDYFWKKKALAQVSSDITNLIKTYQVTFKRSKVILIGYSFGADVMPFVYNNLPAGLRSQVVNINLLSPSAYTDFEVHVLGLFGASITSGQSVVAEINKITAKPLTLIFGKGENDFQLNQLKIKNYTRVILDGGHHYDDNETKVCATIIQHMPKI